MKRVVLLVAVLAVGSSTAQAAPQRHWPRVQERAFIHTCMTAPSSEQKKYPALYRILLPDYCACMLRWAEGHFRSVYAFSAMWNNHRAEMKRLITQAALRC